MRIMDKAAIIKQHEISCEVMYQATCIGDYKTNNREGAKLIRIFKMFEKNPDFAMECISELLKSKNVVVRSKAAAYCLALGRNTDVGEHVLEEISKDPATGIFGFNAEMTLKVWREKGELCLYQK